MFVDDRIHFVFKIYIAENLKGTRSMTLKFDIKPKFYC